MKRVEDYLDLRLFERSGYAVQLTKIGADVKKSLEKIDDILHNLKEPHTHSRRLKIGLSPLLSGRDATKLLKEALETEDMTFDIEFLDAAQMASRHDFDVRIVLPALRRRSTVWVDFPTRWIGTNPSTFIYSKQESDVWDMARNALIQSGSQVTGVIEVNDCGYAYHMAAAGAGFTPCVMTSNISFREDELPGLPPLPPVRLDIFAQASIANRLRSSLGAAR